MTKILHVITDLDVGGAEMVLTQAAPALAQRGFQQAVISLSSPGALETRLRNHGIPVTSLGMKAGCPSLSAFRKLRALIRDFQPDLIHSWLYHADLYASLAAQRMSVPVIWGLHNATLSPDAKLSTKAVVRLLAWLSNKIPCQILTCSQSGGENHIRLGYAGQKMIFVPNGFDTDRFCPNVEIRQRKRLDFGVSADEILIGNVSRFDAQKDHRTLINAWGQLVQREPKRKLRFLLAGKGLDAVNSQLLQWLSEAGISDRTLLLGIYEDIPHVLNALDLFVLSSIGEAFPVALGEAMAAGLPCISTNVGDAALLLGAAGTNVPPADAQALTSAMQTFLNLDSADQMKLGVMARERILANFSLERMIDAYIEIYQSCLIKAKP